MGGTVGRSALPTSLLIQGQTEANALAKLSGRDCSKEGLHGKKLHIKRASGRINGSPWELKICFML